LSIQCAGIEKFMTGLCHQRENRDRIMRNTA
jgi:hypothetical protein